MKYKELFKDGIDLLKGKKATECWYYEEGIYKYKTEDGYIHLLIKDKDVLADKRAIDCVSSNEGIYEYKTEDRKWHKVEKGDK